LVSSETKCAANNHVHRNVKAGVFGHRRLLKTSAKRGCFLSFECEKPNFTNFAPRLEIFRKTPLAAPHSKKTSDAMVTTTKFPLEPLSHIGQIKNKPQDLLVNINSGNRMLIAGYRPAQQFLIERSLCTHRFD